MNKGKSYAGGVALLTLSALAAKICGVLFKIPLYAIIGEEGMGYFNSAYVIYTFFYVFTTSGLPVGLSILVSGAVCEKERTAWLKKALAVFGGTGSVICLFLMLFPGLLASAVGNPGARDSIFVLGPALLFVCLEGAIRGYFQGKRNMMPTAVSQCIEAGVKTGLGLWGAHTALKHGATLPQASAWALCGIAAGGMLSLIYLLARLRIDVKKSETAREVLFVRKGVTSKRLLQVVLPVSAAAVVLSVSSVIDLSVVMHRLTSGGLSADAANRLYGLYSGLALPVFNLPAMLISPVASALVPHISSARAAKNGEDKVLSSLSVRIAMIFSLPFVCWFALLPRELLDVLFDGASAEKAAPMLALLAPSVTLVALTTVTGSILQATGRRAVPMISMTAGAVVKIVSSYVFIGRFGISGAPVGTLLCYLCCAAVNLTVILCRQKGRIGVLQTFVFPLLCASAAGICAKLCLLFLPPLHAIVRTGLCVLLSGCLYLAALYLTGCVDDNLLLLLPKGAEIVNKSKKRQTNEGKSKRTDQGSLQF